MTGTFVSALFLSILESFVRCFHLLQLDCAAVAAAAAAAADDDDDVTCCYCTVMYVACSA